MNKFKVGDYIKIINIPEKEGIGYFYPVKNWYQPTVKVGDIFKVTSKTKNGWLRLSKKYTLSTNSSHKTIYIYSENRIRIRSGNWIEKYNCDSENIDKYSLTNYELNSDEKELSNAYNKLTEWANIFQKYTSLTIEEIYKMDQESLDLKLSKILK